MTNYFIKIIDFDLISFQEEFEDIKGVIRILKLKDRQHNGQKDKQRSTKHCTENKLKIE
jgi:hypothetical protein